MKKVILITGASSGFGEATALHLLSLGEWTVYAASRRIERMHILKEKGAHLLKMDVTKQEEISSGVQKILDNEGRIDVLFANAGYGSFGMVETISDEEISNQFEVNVFGIGRLVKSILPTMRNQGSGRIVITASLVAHLSMLGLGWYSASKHALRALSVALRQEVSSKGIKVVLIEPGVVKTGFDKIALDNLNANEYPQDYKDDIKAFNAYIKDSYNNCPNMNSTVACMIKAITKNNPKLVYKTTWDSKILSRIQNYIPQRIMDIIVKKLLKIK